MTALRQVIKEMQKKPQKHRTQQQIQKTNDKGYLTMENNYKEKLGEIVNEAQNVVSSIATEENKQKVAEVAETTVKKVKSLNKKTLIIIAVAVVAVIALFSFSSSDSSSENEILIKEYAADNLYVELKNINEESRITYETYREEEKWIEKTFYIYSAKGNDGLYYVACMFKTENSTDITVDPCGTKKSDCNYVIKETEKIFKKELKQGKKDGLLR